MNIRPKCDHTFTVLSTDGQTVRRKQGRKMIVSAYRYIATATLAIIAVFVEYLGQFLIDFNQIYRHSSVPKKHVSVHFLSFLAQAVLEHGAAATFFVTLCVSRCRESLDCLTL